MKIPQTMVREKFLKILEAGEKGDPLFAEDILFLLSAREEEELEVLLRVADRVRRKNVGDGVHLRGIIEFSNHCSQNCLYCGLRRENRELVRYRMSPREILSTAQKIKAQGVRTIVLQSGEDPWFSQKKITELIRELKDQTGLAITLSLGERSFADYRAWKKAGADRYLLKQEITSSPLFNRLRPGRKLNERLMALRKLKEMGYEVGSGNMVGLPGQKDVDLTQDIVIFQKYDFDMIGIGPFIAHPHTPLARELNGDVNKVLKVLAITRIITRDTNLPATTALGVLDPKARLRALMGGANVIMPDMTPLPYKKNYQIYPGKTEVSMDMKEIEKMVFTIGRSINQDPGYRGRAEKAE